MNTHYIPVLIITLLLPFLLQAQAIKTGEKIRDAKLHKVMNHTSSEASIKDFSDKPTIIHFLNTHCSVSQQSLLTLKNLKKKYGNKLNIIAVTREKQKRVTELLEKLPYKDELQFPIVFEDSVLKSLFPHTLQPHEVWVKADGTVCAISSDEYLTMEQAEKFFTSANFTLPVKEDPVGLNTYSGAPLVGVLYPDYKQHIGQYSFIGDAVEGLSSTTSYAKLKDGMVVIQATNNSIHNLYSAVYKQTDLHKSQFIFKPGDAERFKTGIRSNANLFCYQQMTRTNSIPHAYNIMKRDLDNYFGLHSRLEKRKIKCLVLRMISDDSKFRATATGKSYFTDSAEIIPNISMKVFVKSRLSTLPMYVSDETGYEGNISMILPLNKRDLATMRQTLFRYGLSLTEEERELEVIALD